MGWWGGIVLYTTTAPCVNEVFSRASAWSHWHFSHSLSLYWKYTQTYLSGCLVESHSCESWIKSGRDERGWGVGLMMGQRERQFIFTRAFVSSFGFGSRDENDVSVCYRNIYATTMAKNCTSGWRSERRVQKVKSWGWGCEWVRSRK